jgi:hypothetical protein
MSLFRSLGKIFKPIEKALRPLVKPAVGLLATAFAPAAAPLIQGVLGLAGTARSEGSAEDMPQGYFPQPYRVQLAHAPYMDMLQGTPWAPNIPIASTPRIFAETVDWGVDAYDEMQDEYDDYDLEEM